jgi:hypothetical protein
MLLFFSIKLLLINNNEEYMHKNFEELFRDIKNTKLTDYNDKHKINIDRNSINQYKIINLLEYKNLATNIINSRDVHKSIKKIVELFLPHVHLNGKSIDIDNCVLVDLLYSNIQTFPLIHTDIEWGVFNESDGFQIWYLYENDDSVGNMFILETDQVQPSTCLHYIKDNRVELQEQCGGNIIKTYNNSDIKPTIKYLDMREGECLIFGKNLYHFSDHRKSKYRYSINFRIVIKDTDGGIPIDMNPKCDYHSYFIQRLKNKNIKIVNNKIYPGMFDLLYFL